MTNFPLRGGKFYDFEGGVRSAAFVSGGYLPPAVRGSSTHGYGARAGLDPGTCPCPARATHDRPSGP